MEYSNSFLKDKKQVMDFLSKPNISCSGMTYGDLKLPFEITSEEFLEYAKADLKERNNRALVNALSNIKKAIDSRIASLLYSFGVYEKSKIQKWDFPESIDFLCKIDVVSPNILKKINHRRNELEHEFRKPTIGEVLDFLDVASLFLESTNYFLKSDIDIDITLKDREFPWLNITLKPEDKKIELLYWLDNQNSKHFTVLNTELDFLYFLGMIVKGIKKRQ